MNKKHALTLKGLSALLLGITMVTSSCEKDQSTNLTPSTDGITNDSSASAINAEGLTMATTTPTSGNLLFQSTFDSSTDLNQWYNESTTAKISLTSSPVKYGTNSGKFVLNKTDPDVAGSKRAELIYWAEHDGPVKSKRWYGLSMFLPSTHIADPTEEMLMQWKGVSTTSLDGYSMANPPIALLTNNGRWQLNIKSTDKMNTIDLGTYATNVWTDWVFNIHFSYEADGLMQIWKNGVLVLDRKGPNTFKDVRGNFFKMGIYKYGWKEGYTSNTTQRTVYFDEFKVGNENSSYNEVAPRSKSGSTPTPTPTTTTPTTTAPGVVFAVNAGGSAFKASNGITYQADQKYSGGSIYKTTSAISNTTDDILYQSERYGKFTYSIPVANGTYQVTFKFAEIYQKRIGARQFDILAEGSMVISNLDLFAVAGFASKHDVVKTVTVTDGVLNIQSNSDINYAKISAFHVVKL